MKRTRAGFDLGADRESTDDSSAARSFLRCEAPSQTLAPGDTGSQVTILQRALAALGF